MKVIVAGGRGYGDVVYLYKALDRVKDTWGITELIHGNASGADSIAREWANERGVKQSPFLANWQEFGKSAGPKRNEEMACQNPDMVILFPGGTGTADMRKRAQDHKIIILEFPGRKETA
jgi:hypothetical protein